MQELRLLNAVTPGMFSACSFSILHNILCEHMVRDMLIPTHISKYKLIKSILCAKIFFCIDEFVRMINEAPSPDR